MSSNSSNSPAPVKNLAGAKVTVVGLGRFGGGIGVTRWLCSQGAKVTVSDQADATSLAESVAALAGCDVALHLGSHEEADFLAADLLVVSPAVPNEIPPLQTARRAGVAITTEINLFLQQCPADVIGITGTVGKSTTTAMIGEVLSAKFTTHVGGNIGRCLLDSLPDILPGHKVVLELSSFQLDNLPLVGISPSVALVTNLMPNHLDRHGTLDAYGDAKKNIFRFQSADDVLILNSACEATRAWQGEAPGRVELFDPQAKPFDLAIPGDHNQANAQAAWAIARACGLDCPAAAAALREFAGLQHRLQFITERDGVRYYNDSKCTTPEGAIVAAKAFAPRTAIIIAGGYDKGVSFDEMGESLADQAKAVITMGATQQAIIDATRRHCSGDMPVIEKAADLADAVALAGKHATAGDAVLLSPACASYDMFTNYEQRGEAFIELVLKS